MLKITINDQPIEVESGKTILQIARDNGIEIPTLCQDPQLSLTGSCRLCVVEVKGWRNMPAACTTSVSEGMVIYTESPVVVEARRVILELLLANHPLDCLTCEKAGNCLLQDYCYRYGVRESRFKAYGGPYDYLVEDSNPFVLRDYNKCIMCNRCVRACEEITGASALTVQGRGHEAKIATPFDRGYADSSCIFCGQCVMACPTGALTNRPEQGKARDYDRKVLTTCGYCGVGCTLELKVKNNQIVGVDSNRTQEKSPVNQGALCVKGRYGWEFINSPDRLTDPLIKKDGKFQKASWDEALRLVVDRLTAIKKEHGTDSLAVVSSARITNEENYLIQKFCRAVLGTNNIDHCARL